jgi:CRP-like cAMP-binding protein
MTEAEDERSTRLFREIFIAGFMSGLPASNVAWAAARLASTMTDVRVPAGGIIYEKSDPTDYHFFVVEGEVKLEAEGAPPYVFGVHSLIGIFDLLIGRPRSRRAVATKSTQLLRISSSDWLDMMEDNFELTRSAIEGLATDVAELRTTLGEVPGSHEPRARLVKDAGDAKGLGLVDRIFAIESVALFADASVQALTNLALVTKETVFEEGDVVFERGVPNDDLVAILSGEVQGTRSESGFVESFGPGDLVFGASAVGTAPVHEARAAKRTRALRIAREDYLDVVEEHFALARSSLKAIMIERELLMNEKGRRKPQPEERSLRGPPGPSSSAARRSVHRRFFREGAIPLVKLETHASFSQSYEASVHVVSVTCATAKVCASCFTAPGFQTSMPSHG